MNSHSLQLLLAFGIAIIIYLVYIARKFTKAPIAMVEIAPTRSVEIYNDRTFEVHNDRGFEYWNPREIRSVSNRSVQIHHPYDLRRMLRGLRSMKTYLVAGGVLMIYILRSIVIGPIAGLMVKGLLL